MYESIKAYKNENGNAAFSSLFLCSESFFHFASADNELLLSPGNCDIPPNWPENQKLATWVQTQRTRFAHERMSQERIDKLRAIDFKLEPFERERIWSNPPSPYSIPPTVRY